MKIIGIDQSYSCTGLTFFEDGEMLRAEVFKTTKEFDIHERAQSIALHILSQAFWFEPDVVGIEGLAFGMRGDATRDLAGLQYVIINKLRFEGNFKVEVVAPNAVKKFTTGSGRAKKEELYEALPQKTQTKFLELGVKKTTGLYDLTDAYWIAKLTEDKNK